MFVMRYWKPTIKTSKRSYLLVLFYFFTCALFAQNSILFINGNEGKIIKAKVGDQLSISYRGYLGQTESFISTLTQINDSTFVLGTIQTNKKQLFGKTSNKANTSKEIKYSDVIAFRRSGPGRVILKATLTLATAIGSILLLDKLNETSELSDFGKIGFSLGIGLGINMLTNLALPDHPKYKTSDGWQINPVKE